MDDPRLLRIILFGLVLGALTIGYLIFSGRILKPQTNTAKTVQTTQTKTTVTASPVPGSVKIVDNTSPSLATPSAYTRILERSQQISTLPKTGTQDMLFGVISVSAVIAGWSLRKFPR